MASVAQVVERWIVIPVAEGSSPFARPMFTETAPVAQLDRAVDFESKGRRFESSRARQTFPSLQKILIFLRVVQ